MIKAATMEIEIPNPARPSHPESESGKPLSERAVAEMNTAKETTKVTATNLPIRRRRTVLVSFFSFIGQFTNLS